MKIVVKEKNKTVFKLSIPLFLAFAFLKGTLNKAEKEKLKKAAAKAFGGKIGEVPPVQETETDGQLVQKAEATTEDCEKSYKEGNGEPLCQTEATDKTEESLAEIISQDFYTEKGEQTGDAYKEYYGALYKEAFAEGKKTLDKQKIREIKNAAKKNKTSFYEAQGFPQTNGNAKKKRQGGVFNELFGNMDKEERNRVLKEIKTVLKQFRKKNKGFTLVEVNDEDSQVLITL